MCVCAVGWQKMLLEKCRRLPPQFCNTRFSHPPLSLRFHPSLATVVAALLVIVNLVSSDGSACETRRGRLVLEASTTAARNVICFKRTKQTTFRSVVGQRCPLRLDIWPVLVSSAGTICSPFGDAEQTTRCSIVCFLRSNRGSSKPTLYFLSLHVAPFWFRPAFVLGIETLPSASSAPAERHVLRNASAFFRSTRVQ